MLFPECPSRTPVLNVVDVGGVRPGMVTKALNITNNLSSQEISRLLCVAMAENGSHISTSLTLADHAGAYITGDRLLRNRC